MPQYPKWFHLYHPCLGWCLIVPFVLTLIFCHTWKHETRDGDLPIWSLTIRYSRMELDRGISNNIASIKKILLVKQGYIILTNQFMFRATLSFFLSLQNNSLRCSSFLGEIDSLKTFFFLSKFRKDCNNIHL